MSEAKLITCSCKKQYLPLIVKNHDLKSQIFVKPREEQRFSAPELIVSY